MLWQRLKNLWALSEFGPKLEVTHEPMVPGDLPVQRVVLDRKVPYKKEPAKIVSMVDPTQEFLDEFKNDNDDKTS